MFTQYIKKRGLQKTILMVPALLILLFLFSSCKKDSVIDYPTLLNNTTWTGEYHNNSEPAQYYSVRFRDDGNFLWFEPGPILNGTWKLEGNKLKLIFNDFFSTRKSLEADISRDKKLTKITTTGFAIGYTVVSGQPNTVTEQPLQGTVWKNNTAEIKFETDKTIKCTGLQYPTGLQVTGSCIRNYGMLLFSNQANPVFTNFYAVLQPDGKTMQVLNPRSNTWIALSKQ